MFSDSDGNKPKWWQWALSGLQLAGGIALCFVPGAQGLGVALIASGVTSMASNIMSAAGVDGKTASIISSALSIAGGIALCFSPFAAVGANMIGSGVGGIAGGYISEGLGFNFETGAMIGNIVGGIVGGKVYDGIHFSAIAKQGILIGRVEDGFEVAANARGLASYNGMPGYSKVEKVFGSGIAGRLGWANNHRYIANVMKYNGNIYSLGGQQIGSYGKEIALIGNYARLIWV